MKTCGYEFGTLLWYHLMLQKKKLKYGCTTTDPLVHNSPKTFGKIHFLYDFW